MKTQNSRTIFDVKIKVFTDDYNFKRNKALRYYRLAEACNDEDGKNTLLDKSEKWMLKAEEVLKKIEETKLSKKLVLQKRDDLNNNQLKTNQGENIL